ncbi:anaerobic selenocysteine-containing dehydrogenase [Kitasatospora sp. MAP12-15]|uniref:molybdopterin-dependent oxidoreductase n=1 Tax=unclassified Kitasatospora TaxID=2633591 RepID=UPI002475B625|nr:molybdopterin-dependent oxidoreductase [Kitasatospora sp. MAP12-44]MDH6109437.1 anaerobic selenocysteine-containing dehydrogenase [Kitasatospora sp. MAP12-44]
MTGPLIAAEGFEAVSHRTCPLCEATCGLTVTLGPAPDGGGPPAISVRGDEQDPFSRGYLCPKGVALGQLHNDPDRLRTPLIRRGATWTEVGWDEAFAEAGRLLAPVVREHGRDAVAVYLGNPTVHNHGASLYTRVLVQALGTGYRFSASTVDQMPKQVASGLMYGTDLSIAIPDLDRTDYLLILGANPLVSNGSLLTAPDLPGRLRALRRRGGRLVVVDPRRTRTAEVADEHLEIRPGSDALLLAGLAHTLLAEGLADPAQATPHLNGLAELRLALAPFTPEAVAAATRIPAATIRRLARELAAAPSAAVYGRIGTTTTAFGTAASWLVDVVNTLTGNLDRPGGVLWPEPAAGSPNTTGEPGRGRGVRVPGSRRTRVRQLASVFGEFPAAALAEEIDVPGPGQLRALITFAGNPVLSTPNSARLAGALASLEAMVSIDAYLNETTRHAHVLLPAASPLTRSHYDLVFTGFAIRNTAKYSPPSLPLAAGELDESEVLLRLACTALGGALSPDELDDLTAADTARRLAADPSSPAYGRDPVELLAAVAHRRRQDRLLDLQLRGGPYGDGFGAKPEGLSLDALEAAPHGLDLGPLRPRLPGVLRTPSGKVELAPPQLLAEAQRLADHLAELAAAPADGLLLVGRRQLRSNNSWMHNVPLLAGGSNRCTLQLNPADAERLGITADGPVTVRSRVGEVSATAEITDTVMPGVVSLPHGWGQGGPGTRGAVAAREPGVNSNLLTDEGPLDLLSGTAVLNGIPVEVQAG